jgi:hypothetical protein
MLPPSARHPDNPDRKTFKSPDPSARGEARRHDEDGRSMTQPKKVTTADIDSIYIVLDNNLRRVKDEVVKNLAASMKQIGLMTPITVRPIQDDEGVDRWVLIAGQHRLAAAKLLGWERLTSSRSIGVTSTRGFGKYPKIFTAPN